MTPSERKAWRYAYTAAHGLPDHVDHGASAYGNWGCRCDICRAARSADSKRRQRRRHADMEAAGGELPPGVEHGVTAYRNYGCHCEICKAAHAADARDRRKR